MIVRPVHSLPAAVLTVLLVLCFPAGGRSQSAEINTEQRYMKAGVQQLQQGDYSAARDSFEAAIRSYDNDAEAYVGLGVACAHLGDDTAAGQALEHALELKPRHKTAYVVLGELAYRRDDLEAALSFWRKALEIDPSDAALKAKVDRIGREHRTEQDMNHDVTSHFSVKYEGRERVEAGKIVLRILEDAYGDVGRALSYYPDREISVILYSDRQFQEVTDAPGWSGGVFDGKIRLPIGGIETETPGLRRILYHEYTHAVVRAVAPRVPTWLNEGLAQYFEGRSVDGANRDILRDAVRSGKLPQLRGLEGSFLGLNGQQAAYAYLVSLSAVRYMNDQFGMYRIKMVLENLAASPDTAQAIDKALLVSYDDFERMWKRSLE